MKKYIGVFLWGYPELLQTFHDHVWPVLAESRNDQGREEGPERRTPEVNNADPSSGPSGTRDEEAVEVRSPSSPLEDTLLQEDSPRTNRSGSLHTQQPIALPVEPTDVEMHQASSDIRDRPSSASNNSETSDLGPDAHVEISPAGNQPGLTIANDADPRTIVESAENAEEEGE